MSADFRRRVYTTPLNRIDNAAVEAAALSMHMPLGEKHPMRRGTLTERTAEAMTIAIREQERFAENPLAQAIDQVDAAIAEHCSGGLNDDTREAAILACDLRRPAVICRRYSPSAMLAANAVHAGECLGPWMLAEAERQGRDLQVYAGHVFEVLRGASRQGGQALDEARWLVSARVNLERRAA